MPKTLDRNRSAYSTVGTAPGDRDQAEPATTAGPPGRPAPPLTAYLWEQAAALAEHEVGARAGDPTSVHKLRVATRRLRSTLRTFAPVLDPDRTAGLAAELKWLGGVLGEVRDGQVMTQRLTAAVAELPDELAIGPVAARIRQRLATPLARARAELTATLDSDRYVVLRAGVRDLAAHGELGPAGPKQLHRRAHKALRRADRRLAHALATGAGPVPAEPTPGVANREERLHDARKAYKRARYAVEVLAPGAGQPAQKLAKRLGALQDVLGAYQDSRASRDLLRAYGMQAHLDGENSFTYGLLYAREEAAGGHNADLVPAAHHRTGRKRVRRWLEHPPARYR